jgi:hypothetical protein
VRRGEKVPRGQNPLLFDTLAEWPFRKDFMPFRAEPVNSVSPNPIELILILELILLSSRKELYERNRRRKRFDGAISDLSAPEDGSARSSNEKYRSHRCE